MKHASTLIFCVLLTALLLQAQKPALQTQKPVWIDCVLISKTGDAIKAQLKSKKDFSAMGCLLPGQEIIIRHNDGKEVITPISNISEILVPRREAGYNHYLVLNNNPNCPGQYHIYRVITEGPCKLLYTQMPGRAGNMTVNISHHGETISTLNQKVADEYYLFYNKTLTQAHVDEALYPNAVSKNDCVLIFKSCPELLKKLRDKSAKAIKINELVEEFNKCGR